MQVRIWLAPERLDSHSFYLLIARSRRMRVYYVSPTPEVSEELLGRYNFIEIGGFWPEEGRP
jgi:hypothetical protein